jgi:hypothetical protein
MAKFSKKEALSFGWQTATKNVIFFAKILALTFFLPFFLSLVAKSLEDSSFVLAVIFNTASQLLSFGFSLGLIVVTLKFVDRKTAQVDDLFSAFKIPLLIKYFIGILIYALVPGLILVVPFGMMLILGLAGRLELGLGLLMSAVVALVAIYVALRFVLRFQFYPYFLVDKNTEILESFRRSFKATSGSELNLLSFLFLGVLVVLAGFLAFWIGLLWAIPTWTVALAYVYRKLSS